MAMKSFESYRTIRERTHKQNKGARLQTQINELIVIRSQLDPGSPQVEEINELIVELNRIQYKATRGKNEVKKEIDRLAYKAAYGS